VTATATGEMTRAPATTPIASRTSTQFGSLGSSDVSLVGIELDRKLAALLELLAVDVPEPLLQS
jgi:hypothetical protein